MEAGGRRGEAAAARTTYCVTGANGFIGSCLVKLLLQNGYTVHATLRDPAKSLYLLSSWGGGDRLRLFKADLQEEGSFDEAVKSCDGVFHVAASMEFNVVDTDNIETNVRSKVIDPAVEGTLNLLRSCLKSKSVKRVVFTSSISTLTAKDGTGRWRRVVDETCRTPVENVLHTKASGWVYALSKLLTEEAAFKYANDNGIDLVSVISTTVAGKFVTSRVPSSIQVLLSPITGDDSFFSILSAVEARMGSIGLVHIEDICNAHIFLMQNSKAQGQYICCAGSCTMHELIDHLMKEYPSSNVHRFADKKHGSVPSEISSKKLTDLGFNYKHGLKDIICETIASCIDHRFLAPSKGS